MARKTQSKLYWHKITPKHVVVEVKVKNIFYPRSSQVPYDSHYETGSGALIYWSDHEGNFAQSWLSQRKKRTIIRKK